MARKQWWTLAKEQMNEQTATLGHTLTWKRQPRPSREHALIYEGTCGDCSATVEIGSTWSSCRTIRDARSETCSGPGTAVLTEIEQERADELMGDAIAEFADTLAEAGIKFERPKAPFRNPEAPAGQCGLMSADGYTCIRRLNRRGTHNGNEWGSPGGHVGTHPDDDFTRGFDDDRVLYA